MKGRPLAASWCAHCETYHRKPEPVWLADAVAWYHAGLSCREIGSRVAVSWGTVRNWLRHADVDVRTGGQTMRLQAGRAGKTVRLVPESERPLCGCGCGKEVSGKVYAEPVNGGGWRKRIPQYLPGHHLKRKNGERQPRRPRGPRTDRLPLTGARKLLWHWIRNEKRWSAQTFEEETGIPWRNVLYRARISPENLVRAAEALKKDPAVLLKADGWPEPSPLGWLLLRALIAGQTRKAIERMTGVDAVTIGNILRHPERVVNQNTLEQLERVLKPNCKVKTHVERWRRKPGPAARTWTRSEVRRLRKRLLTDGVPYRTVAKELGLSERTVILKARALKIDKQHAEIVHERLAAHRATPEQLGQLQGMLADGTSCKDAAGATGLSLWQVQEIAREKQLPRRGLHPGQRSGVPQSQRRGRHRQLKPLKRHSTETRRDVQARLAAAYQRLMREPQGVQSAKRLAEEAGTGIKAAYAFLAKLSSNR